MTKKKREILLCKKAEKKVSDLPECRGTKSYDRKKLCVVMGVVMVMVAEVTPTRHTVSYPLRAVGQVDSCNLFSCKMGY